MAVLGAAVGLRSVGRLRRHLLIPAPSSAPPPRRYCLSSAEVSSAPAQEGGRTVGQTLSLATAGGESVDVIDVNPPRGTRDFAPDEMRLRNWLFHNFREVSRLFAFEEVDFPVLESEALFTRKAGEEITEQF